MKFPKFLLFGFLLSCLGGQLDRVQAQFVLTSGSGSYSSTWDFEFRSDATLIAKGVYGTGSLAAGDQGAGVRLLWYPSKAALRAGKVTGVQWDDSGSNLNVGSYSVAMGYNTTASGTLSVAIGNATTASGLDSVAFGINTAASGSYSTAFGVMSYAIGNTSTALGNNTSANGTYSTSLGYFTQANATASTAMGYVTQAYAYASTTIGRYNLGPAICTHAVVGDTTSQTAWYLADPLFEIGNGTSTTAANAVTVYKNGTSTFQGMITATAGVTTTAASISSTDIPMYGH